jgi:hypothetical protein
MGKLTTAHLASAQGAVATGARATGSAAVGALAIGALAVGAVAIGALAIGRLAVGRARFGRVEIDRLAIGQLEIGGLAFAPSTAVAQIRARPGQGDAIERLLRERALVVATDTPNVPLPGARRSIDNPDLFLLFDDRADGAASLATLRQRLMDADLGDVVEVEVYRPV